MQIGIGFIHHGTPNLSSNKPLKLVADGVDIDYGYLNVGGNATSSTRYGVIEVYRDGDWTIEDEYQTVKMYQDPDGSDAQIQIPSGANSINIYRLEYDVNGVTTDADETQWFQVQIGGNTCDVQAADFDIGLAVIVVVERNLEKQNHCQIMVCLVMITLLLH